MNHVQERASLHEKAVQAVAEGNTYRAPRTPRKKAEKRSSDVSHIKVNELVWQEAQQRKVGSYTSIEVISETEVLVR